jgi:hypothetical protein
VFGGVVELQTAEQAMRFRRRKGLVERTGSVRRQVVQDDSDLFGFGIMDVDKLAHALGEVTSRTLLGDL